MRGQADRYLRTAPEGSKRGEHFRVCGYRVAHGSESHVRPLHMGHKITVYTFWAKRPPTFLVVLPEVFFSSSRPEKQTAIGEIKGRRRPDSSRIHPIIAPSRIDHT